ncbi:AEC family transporter [Carboxylicivirga sp. M1479]|uniref:AEC family transporter n=1 Tax=Carboxylicivirga sp. M1479 TaxID=2594476 RepID=UPI0011779379|nr:AEC family transporter [Carboxylicivirga sp. M1479]TRX70212.1 permease [Carboxylicivirga sp. M1479]
MITSTFIPVFKAVLSIFLIAIASGIMVRRQIIKQSDIQSMSHITIVILLPCLFFAKIISSFDPSGFVYWWVLPLVAFVMIGVALGIAYLLFYKQRKQKKAIMAVASFMNANYMVLPIAIMLYSVELDEFLTYCFMFILGVSTALWSIGKYMVTSGENESIKMKEIVNPPLIASLGSILIVLLGLENYIPSAIMIPVDFLGQAAIPIATIVLGATLGSISVRHLPPFSDVIKVVGIKLFLMPALVIALLYWTQWLHDYPLIADLLVLQASVAPATLLIVQVRKYGGNAQEVGSMMLINYIICLLTIPGWLTIWRMLIA